MKNVKLNEEPDSPKLLLELENFKKKTNPPKNFQVFDLNNNTSKNISYNNKTKIISENDLKLKILDENEENLKHKNLPYLQKMSFLLKETFLDLDDISLPEEIKKEYIVRHIESFQNNCIEEETQGEENSNFNFKQFLEIFILHLGFFLFGIFIIPLYRIIYGPELIRNLGFWGKRLTSSRNAQISYWITFIITVSLSIRIYLSKITDFENNNSEDLFYKQYIFLSLSYISILLVLLRYVIVSIKYGFFPINYFKDFKSKILHKSNLKVNFLKYGWIEPDFSIIDIYLKSAFKLNNTSYKAFNLDCAGDISDELRKGVSEIEAEIEYRLNKKRESYKRKIKKEKMPSIINLKRSSIIKKFTQEEKNLTKEDLFLKEKTSILNIDANFKMSLFLDSIGNIEKNEIFGEIIEQNNLNKNLGNISSENSNDSSNSGERNLSENLSEKIDKNSEPMLKKLKTYLHKSIRNHSLSLKNSEKQNRFSLKGKLEIKNNFIYKIRGVLLAKIIMKKIDLINFKKYKCFHLFLVILLLIIPNIFIFKIYFLTRPLLIDNNASSQHIINYSNYNISPILIEDNNNKTNFYEDFLNTNSSNFNQSKNNSTKNNTNIHDKNFEDMIKDPLNDIINIKFNNISICLLIFSFISCIIPVWLNTENLIYGLIDFSRRRKIMEILYDIINPNVNKTKSDLPLLDITSQKTMLNWYNLRTIMMKYGKRFTDRIIIQTSVLGIFQLINLIFMMIIFFGFYEYFGNIICLVISFASNILILFIIVLIMIKIGADFNYYENRHTDLLNSNKMFIDNIYAELKYELLNEDDSWNNSNDLNSSANLRSSLLEIIPKNEKNIFFNILKSKDYRETDDMGNLNNYHMDSVIIYNNISDKIKMDHILRPLRIFWIKSDYFLFNKIITLILGGLFMYLKYILKDIGKLFKK